MQKVAKKVILVTAGQPALNPRLVKEADALSDAGYEVTVIYAYWNDWGDEFTKQLLLSKRWKTVCAGGHPVKQPLTYLLSRLMFKIARRVSGTIFPDAAIARSTPFLIRETARHQADLYIGHNLGALPAVVKAAKKYKATCGFDAEDFHRMEVNDDTNSVSYLVAKSIEDRYFPLLNYITASSPEITNAYQQLYPQKFETILNVFDPSVIKVAERPNGKLRLFWFSQMIGTQRGLQDVIEALNSLSNPNYELHLLGKISPKDEQFFTGLAQGNFTHFHSPVSPNEIIPLGAQFDIGLALEPGFNTNNRIALSNKLFSYLQSGLAIIATETEAQNNFLKANPGIGRTYKPGDVDGLKAILTEWQENPVSVDEMRQNSMNLGNDQFNWQTESKKFLKLVNDTLNNN